MGERVEGRKEGGKTLTLSSSMPQERWRREDGAASSAATSMEPAHLRQMRYYQGGGSHGYYNQYQPRMKESSSWSLWQDHPPYTPSVRPRRRRRWCNILAAVVTFLVILAVILIAGLAIYMGALRLEVSQFLVLEGSFRVVIGDSYNSSLADHSSDLFQRKAQVYKFLIESIFRRSDLSYAFKQCSILGFTNGSLVVFFRLILDRRKIPKRPVSLEEHVTGILIKEVARASPVQNIKIDKTQVFLKRLGDEPKLSAQLEEVENKNQSFEIHNGLLRKSPPRTLTSYYTSRPTDKVQMPKTSVENNNTVKGSFTYTSSEPQAKDQTTSSSNSSDTLTEIPLSSQEYQTNVNPKNNLKKASRTDISPTIDFYPHSPALNAFLFQKQRTENTKSATQTPELTEPTEPILSDLITLLPYIFQSEEEPWKPILPENFTRYPERRPTVLEDYNSGGVGVVEVVLDPEDLTSSIPIKPVWPNEGIAESNPSLSYNDKPTNINLMPSFNQPTNLPKDIFQPRSDDKVTFLLNTQMENHNQNKEYYEKVHGDILTKHKSNKEMKENTSLLQDSLPDFPILKQFHDLDAFLRSYDSKVPKFTHEQSEIPVTLLPARSNIDMKKQIRPRPELMRRTNPTSKKNSTNILQNSHIILEVITDSEVNRKNPMDKDSIRGNRPFANLEINNSQTDTLEPSHLELQTQIPFGLSSKESQKISFVNPNYVKGSFNTPLMDGLADVPKETEYRSEVSLSSNLDIFPEISEEVIEQEDELTTVSDTSSPSTISPGTHRSSKMTNTFQVDSIPFKVDLQNNKLLSDSDKIINVTRHIFNDSLSTSKQSEFTKKLKDAKIQDLLEHMILHNQSAETLYSQLPPTEQEFSPEFLTTNQHNFSNDVNIAHNRKYGHNSWDNKNSLTGNSSLIEGKPDIILYYLKHRNNESESYSSSYVKNGNSEKNKNVSNYVLNKDGFLMLTKVYNKVQSNVQANSQELAQSNTAGNHTTECSGEMHIKCGSGECINSQSRCNQLVDCSDGSDEKNCTCAEFLKAQYLTRKLCDGVVDCWDFSDENTCEWCHSGQYVCSNSRVCVDREQVCDGQIDCPNGDDEKNCVSIAPNISQADSMEYHSSGILIIRKEGHWGKLCTENFDSLSSFFKSRWSLEDLGKVVCRKMTFRTFSSIEHVNDTSHENVKSNKYYELLHSSEGTQNQRLGLTFGNTNCSEKKVVRITCSNLECGIRPQANPQWGRTKRVPGVRHSRIVGGGNAGPGSWPWLAALYKEGEFQCGATLISDRWLLSAGHCFYHALDEFWVARLGALRRGTNLPSPYEQLRVISHILLHPNYVDSGFINDISLLQMKEPVSFTNYVRPICLPPPSAILQDGKMCTVIGWGQLFEVGRIFPDTLQEVQLPVISTAECRKRTLFLPLYRVTENMFCAGYDRGGRDACLGDSGGPLMCQESDGHWSLMGVTSNGYGCARANRPGVYTKVANYVEWVHSSMNNGTHFENASRRNVSCHGLRCPLGECLPSARICNGFTECSDGSDEKDCW